MRFFKIVVVFQGNGVNILFADQEEKEKPVFKLKDGKIRLFDHNNTNSLVFFLDFKSKLADLQDFYIFGSFLLELRKISQSHITVQKRKIKGQIGDNNINHGSWETVFHGYYRFIRLEARFR